MKNSNLSILVEALKSNNEDNELINEFILENFDNQNQTEYAFDDVDFYIFDKETIQEQLDDDFKIECSYYLESSNHVVFASIINKLDVDCNYKSVNNDFDSLLDYDLYYFDSVLLVGVYTLK